MLRLPETGISSSREVHNCDLQKFCDWLEGSLLFTDTEGASRTDVADILEETGIYTDQSFAAAWLDQVWCELQRRHSLLSLQEIVKIGSRSVQRATTWQMVPTYSFCLLVSLLSHSPNWRPPLSKKGRARYFQRQGQLFERVSMTLLKSAGWNAYLTGWSYRNAKKLPAIVDQVASFIGEQPRSDSTRNVSPNANEAGLDIVFYRRFPNGVPFAPIYLAQCAAGEHWDTKLHTPSLYVWNKLIDFSEPPYKAFAIPHGLGQTEIRHASTTAEGVILDRYRLHAGVALPSDSKTLQDELIAFMKPLVTGLPSSER